MMTQSDACWFGYNANGLFIARDFHEALNFFLIKQPIYCSLLLRELKTYAWMRKTGYIQIWIAVSVYELVAIIKKQLNLNASLYTALQI
ncbi:MAG: hypothetical protein PHO08_04115 [Methylococcales bacterium]|nr:hypothetical protein [Methylococcales bacterium]MDD5630470.1 hypothetical protein [Methylococcales bacterium]